MTDPALVGDLGACDSEPIHIPGAIQPHGVLLALREPSLTIMQTSDNLAAHFGVAIEDALARPLTCILEPASAELVHTVLQERTWDEQNPLRLRARGAEFDGIVHSHDGAVILELEPAATPDPEANLQRPLRIALKNLQRTGSLTELCDAVVTQTRRLTRFERVMLYRFDDDGHGCVFAEAKGSSLEPYLGLHYPASDIPQQARRLYLRNWLRIIPDARYSPASLVPRDRPDTGRPLDLSFAVLRSVSPIHLEYLANLGARASMSISLIVRDQLWGLITCVNHSGPVVIPYSVRSACEVLGRLTSLQVAALADRDAANCRLARRGAHAALVGAMEHGKERDDVLSALVDRPAELLGLVAARGAAVLAEDDTLSTCGSCPEPAVIRAIGEWLDTRGLGSPFATDAVPMELPSVVDAKDVASGLLTFALPGTRPRRLVWFRPEFVETVHWGGDPRKPVEPDRGLRLHPRRSFDDWQEKLRLRSRPWTSDELEAAEELRRNAVEIDLERQVARARLAIRARDDLVAVVSHDLRNPLNVVQIQAALLLRSALPTDDVPMRRLRAITERIQRSVDHMNALITDLLDLAKIEAGRFSVQLTDTDIGDIVEEVVTVMRPLADAKGIRLVAHLDDGLHARADSERLFQVLSNIVGNAIKFTPHDGAIVVRATRARHELVLSVSDSGPGIAAESLPHVFDRYWQARKSGSKGSGLGLYIAKGIVEAHGGTIAVESRPGHGATFTVALPAG